MSRVSHLRRRQQRIERLIVARAAILDRLGAWQRGTWSWGRLRCPVCGVGWLEYDRAWCTGHLTAHCTTPGCVSWIE